MPCRETLATLHGLVQQGVAFRRILAESRARVIKTRPMSRQIFIHAGAHRTGTSSFQLCMATNRERLEADGFDLSYPSRDGVPGGLLALRLPKPRNRPESIPRFTEKLSKILAGQVSEEREKLILSEENLPGIIRHLFEGRIHPNCRKRLLVFRDAMQSIDGDVKHLLFVVRPYADVFLSGYRKHAEDNAIAPFSELSELMTDFKGGWPRTIKFFRQVLDADRITVVEYGARGDSRMLLARLLEYDADSFIEPQRALNVSATDAALIALQNLYADGADLSRQQWQQIIREHAENTEDLGFAKFNPSQKAKLDAQYADDLAKIRTMRRVRLIE